MEGASFADIRQRLKDGGHIYKKSLGQNFLLDEGWLKAIVKASGVGENDDVIEIGPGPGGLTLALSQAARHVMAIELDRHLQPLLEPLEAQTPNLRVVWGDAMALDIAVCAEGFLTPPYHIVANLPYYITTPLLMRFLESDWPIATYTVMVQREVAARITARPNTPEYGALTLAVAYRAEARTALKVPAGAFWPPPRVDSSVLHLRALDRPSVEVASPETYFKLVRAAFAMRRKTLCNNLQASFSLTREVAEEVLRKAGIDARARGESLDAAQLAAVCGALVQFLPPAATSADV